MRYPPSNRMASLSLFACILCGCATVQPTAQGRTEPLTLEAIAKARAKWSAAGVRSYDYWPACEYFIAPIRAKNFRVIVRRGKVVNARQFGSSIPVLVSNSPLTFDETFDELQRNVEHNLARGQPMSYGALFHPTLGYPVKLSSRPASNSEIEDTGSICTVKEFRIRWP